MIARRIPEQRFLRAALAVGLCCALFPGSAQAQKPPVTGATLEALSELNFDYLGMREGLPHESVYAVTQDKTGYIWIATFGGLGRYSGYQVHSYTHDPDITTSLPDNNVRTLVARDDGGLWVGTGSAGMAIYDPVKDTFTVPANTPDALRKARVFCMTEDGQGGVWYGSQYGLAHYTHDGKFELYGKIAQQTATATGFPAGSIFSAFVDSQKNLWIGSEQGLYVRKASTEQFVLVPGLEGPGEFGEKAPVWSIFQDHTGRLWIGSDTTGVGVVDLQAWRVRGVPGLAGHSSPIGAHTVRGFIETSPGVLWIATYGGGVFHLDTTNNNAVRHWTKDPTAFQPLSNDFVRCVFKDRSGEVWLGTDSGLSSFNSNLRGIFNIHSSPLRPNQLFGTEVRSVGAGNGHVVVGFDQGGFAIIDGDGTVHRVQPAPGTQARALSNREVLAIKAGDERTFFAGGAGLFAIDVPSMTYRMVDDPSLNGQIINALLVDGDDVWAGSYNGLIRYNRKTRKSHIYAHDISDAKSVIDNYIRDIYKDHLGRMWITTRLGLDLYDPASDSFIHLRHDDKDPQSLGSDNIQPISEDAQGRLWIGTMGAGLTILEDWPKGGKPRFRTLDHKNGLPADLVLIVVRGLDGKMWVNTLGGLAEIDPQTLKVTPYTAADGLPNSAQNLFSSTVLPDGTILFPGASSLVLVRPQQLSPWSYRAPLVLTAVTLTGNSASPLELAQQAMAGTLSFPSHRAFHSHFSLLDYTYPENTEYTYRLDGFDSDWSEPSTSQMGASYTNLPPGNYTFQVRAISRAGAGQMTTLQVPLTVTSRFYETGAFRSIAVLAIIAGVIIFVRIRIEYMTRQHTMLEHEIAQRTAELNENRLELMRANERLAELALHDTLTGLLNRRGFFERAEMETARSARSLKPFSLLLADLDNFKQINDTLGHTAGDECLKGVANVLSQNLRPTDIVARYGGEEIILLLPETGEDVAGRLAERLRLAVADMKLSHNGAPIQMTISVGMTTSQTGVNLDKQIAIVDKALYAAKRSGKNCVKAA